MASGLILTAVGAEAIEAAYQAGEVVTIPIVAFGDGGGASVIPDPAVTKLVNKFGDVPFTQGESGSGMIAGQAVINAREHPGKVVREFGLMSSAGVLIAYGAYPDTYLPEQNDSIVKELVVNFAMPLVHAESVVLEIDPNISVLTIEEADGRYLQIKNALSEIAVAGPVAQALARGYLDIRSKTESDEHFLLKAGDTATGQIIAPTFASTPEAMPPGAGSYADQLSTQAPFFQPNWQWSVNSGGIFVPVAKGTSTRKGQGYPAAVSYGYLMPANNEHAHPTIHVRGDSDVDCAWDFNPYNGNIKSKAGTFATQEWVNNAVHTNELHVGEAQMVQDGNIWGTRWNPNGGWLWDAILAQIQNVGDMSVDGNQWWARLNLNGGALIMQGGFFEGQRADDGVIERVPLNISVPNRLLGVWTIVRNYAQGFETTWSAQVQDLAGARDAFNWLHGTKERMIYWIAVGH